MDTTILLITVYLLRTIFISYIQIREENNMSVFNYICCFFGSLILPILPDVIILLVIIFRLNDNCVCCLNNYPEKHEYEDIKNPIKLCKLHKKELGIIKHSTISDINSAVYKKQLYYNYEKDKHKDKLKNIYKAFSVGKNIT